MLGEGLEVRERKELRRKIRSCSNTTRLRFVFCRDLNVFNWGGDDAEDSKKVKNLKPREFTIQQPMTLASGIHSFTNYAVGFIEQLDYIYVKGLKPMGYAECIERSVMEPFTAMPNERMGSDHLSVVCDVSIDDDDE